MADERIDDLIEDLSQILCREKPVLLRLCFCDDKDMTSQVECADG